jgi:ERCC4-type nuclease
MEFAIDVRETALIEQLEGFLLPTVTMTVKALDMGDILVNNTWVFERKTLADLSASIKDGRYREQKARLLAHFPKHCITVIVEGMPAISRWLDVPMLQGAIYNCLFRDGIRIVGTHDVEDTALFIKAFVARLERAPDAFAAQEQARDYTGLLTVKARPCKNITPDVCWRLMLSQVPGVSSKLAAEMAKVWPSMEAFTRGMGALTQAERLKKLREIPLLGPKKAAVLLEFMLPTIPI